MNQYGGAVEKGRPRGDKRKATAEVDSGANKHTQAQWSATWEAREWRQAPWEANGSWTQSTSTDGQPSASSSKWNRR